MLTKKYGYFYDKRNSFIYRMVFVRTHIGVNSEDTKFYFARYVKLKMLTLVG